MWASVAGAAYLTRQDFGNGGAKQQLNIAFSWPSYDKAYGKEGGGGVLLGGSIYDTSCCGSFEVVGGYPPNVEDVDFLLRNSQAAIFKMYGRTTDWGGTHDRCKHVLDLWNQDKDFAKITKHDLVPHSEYLLIVEISNLDAYTKWRASK